MAEQEALEGASAPAAQASRAEKASETGYMVLIQQTAPGPNTASSSPTGGWTIVGTNITARSAEHAVRVYAEKLTAQLADGSRTLVAVPARSWNPVTVATKTTTTLVIEEAS